MPKTEIRSRPSTFERGSPTTSDAAPVTVRTRSAVSVLQKNTGRPFAAAPIVSAFENRERGGGGA